MALTPSPSSLPCCPGLLAPSSSHTRWPCWPSEPGFSLPACPAAASQGKGTFTAFKKQAQSELAGPRTGHEAVGPTVNISAFSSLGTPWPKGNSTRLPHESCSDPRPMTHPSHTTACPKSSLARPNHYASEGSGCVYSQGLPGAPLTYLHTGQPPTTTMELAGYRVTFRLWML